MSDHQFEKNVRKQLEELKFHPDASVWTSVEKRIAGRKKRRGIIWIPLLLLLTAGGIYLLERNEKNNTSQAALVISVSPDDQLGTSSKTPESSQPSDPTGKVADGILEKPDQKQPSSDIERDPSSTASNLSNNKNTPD